MNDLEKKLQAIANGEIVPFENYTEQDWQNMEWAEEMNREE
jgi:hypothetical protein